MKGLISIIIPAFNAADVIERCVHSVLLQDYEKKEILIINDGSTDTTEEICEKLSENYDFVFFYTIENKGVSNARNIGMSLAKGEWFIFLDADDELENGYLKTAISLVENQKVDTICFNAIYVDNEKNYTKMNDIFPEKIFSTKEERENLIQSLYIEKNFMYTGDYFRAVWGKVFSAQIIKDNDLKFPQGVPIGEDAIFLVKYFYYAQRISLINKYLYKYYRSNSTVTGKYKDNFYDIQKSEFVSVLQVLNECEIEEEKIAIQYWHKAEKEYIVNELKVPNSTWCRIQRIRNYLKKDYLRLYLGQYEGKKIKPKIRSLLEKYKFYYVLAVIDYYILKKIEKNIR